MGTEEETETEREKMSIHDLGKKKIEQKYEWVKR